jgi:MFS family permease
MAKEKTAAGTEDAGKFLVVPIIVLIMAQMGTSGDNGALSVANTELVNVLGATTPDIQLATLVYSLMAGALMIAGGLVGTIIGWKKNFRMGALLCAAGEVVAALSPNMTVFIWGARTLTGLGASFMIPSVLGLIPLIYKGKNRVQAFGCIGAASGLSALLPLLLGVIMAFGGFRVVYFVLAAYFLVVFAMSLKLPKIVQSSEHLKFDGVGTGLAALGLFLFLFGISRVSAWGLLEPLADCPFTIFGISPAIPMAIVGVIVLVVMIKLERGIEERNGVALLPQVFLKTPQVLAGLTASAVTFFFMGIQSILLSPYMQLVVGWSSITMGAMSLLVGVPTFLFAILIPKFLPKATPRRVLQVGYLVMAGSLIVILTSLNDDGTVAPAIFAGFVLCGVAIGIMSSHQNNVVALVLDERDASQSGGIQTTMRNVGQAIGVAALGSVLLFGITSNINKAVLSDANVSESVATAISKKSITLMSDASFEQTISDIPMTDAEKEELVTINAKARVDATKTAFVVSVVVVLLALITTRWIKVQNKEEKERYLAERAASAPSTENAA